MSRAFLGVDVGGTKTHAIVADEHGQVLGFGESGAGNHETVGFDGLGTAMQAAVSEALSSAGVQVNEICGAGFGVAGYDWPSEYEPVAVQIRSLRLSCPFELVNDTILGLLAGSSEGWGIAVVSGTGCNCWGWDRERSRIGRVTGGGVMMAEAAGASELTVRALQAVSHAWCKRGPQTALTQAFCDYTGLPDAGRLIEEVMQYRVEIPAGAAKIIFQVADGGDPVASEIIRWAGEELGELVNAVTRQLEFKNLDFEVVMVGSMFDGGVRLIQPLEERIHTLSPRARLVRLQTPPVIGALLLGMEQGGLTPDMTLRHAVSQSMTQAAGK